MAATLITVTTASGITQVEVSTAARGPAGSDATAIDPTALEWSGNNPNIPETLTITGITSPADSDPLELTRTTDSDGYAAWGDEVSDPYVNHFAGEWAIQIGGGNDYSAGVTSDAISPVGLTFEVGAGAGVPTITGDAPTATHLGQWCKVTGTTPDSWWQWNGSEWVARFTDSGQPIAYNATLAAYRKITVSGADGSEVFTISAL